MTARSCTIGHWFYVVLDNTVKQKCHFDEIFITSCTGNCNFFRHFDEIFATGKGRSIFSSFWRNFRYWQRTFQWWNFRQNNDISVDEICVTNWSRGCYFYIFQCRHWRKCQNDDISVSVKTSVVTYWVCLPRMHRVCRYRPSIYLN